MARWSVWQSLLVSVNFWMDGCTDRGLCDQFLEGGRLLQPRQASWRRSSGSQAGSSSVARVKRLSLHLA